MFGSGFCYAKSHLLAALLRANGIPAALCYQRLSCNDDGTEFCLHGLNAIHLPNVGWYRVDARGNRADVDARFTPPLERLAFPTSATGEADIPGLFADPLPVIVNALTSHATADELCKHLPDLELSTAKSMSTLEARPASVADAETISAIADSVFRDAYRSAFESEKQVEDFIASNFTPSVIRTELEAGQAWYSIGLVNGVAAGFIQLESTDPPECVGCRPAIELAKLYVLRSFHGCGIANVLMERGLEHASCSGASQVWLCVWEKNARAIAFYRRWGFETVGEMEFLWSGVLFRDAVMTRNISPATTNQPRRKVDVPFADDAEIAKLVERFEAATWPYERWTHRAHLAVGLTYARAMPFDAALSHMRKHINHYNQTCGDPTGYNETVTILFLRKIASAYCGPNDPRPLHVLVEELVRCCSVDWLYQYYSKERIWSAAAKQSWIEPDRQPLDF